MSRTPSQPLTESSRSELQAFVGIARAGSVGAAATVLGRTQPAVSTRLATLERHWGTRLFQRKSRGMELTPEGRKLLPQAEQLLEAWARLDRDAGLPTSPSSELRLGAGDALGRERLPLALSQLLVEDPNLEIHLREGPGPVLLQALTDGEIDLALIVGSGSRTAQPGLDIQAWSASPIDLLAPLGTRLPRRLRVEWLRGKRQVALPAGSGFRRHLEEAFRGAGIDFDIAVEVGNLSLVRRFVAAGLGIAAVPAIAFGQEERAPKVERARISGIPAVRYERALRSGAPIRRPVHRLLELLAQPDSR